jgi:hypothetical protein
MFVQIVKPIYPLNHAAETQSALTNGSLDTCQQHGDTCQQHGDTCQQHGDTCQQHGETLTLIGLDRLLRPRPLK